MRRIGGGNLVKGSRFDEAWSQNLSAGKESQ